MSSPLRSVADHMNQEALYGDYAVEMMVLLPGGTAAATINSGGTSMCRYPELLTLPPVTLPVTGFYLMNFAMMANIATDLAAALEVSLGTLTVSSNAFTGAGSMPIRSIYDHTLGKAGVATQLASVDPMLVITTTMVGTGVITINYTNQAGVSGRTAVLTLPNNAVANSAFRIAPHLQSGDTGIQSVQGISRTGATGGKLEVKGLVNLAHPATLSGQGAFWANPLTQPGANILLQGGDVIAFYRGAVSTGSAMPQLIFSPES